MTWDPAGERADKIQAWLRDGRLRLECDQQASPAGTQPTAGGVLAATPTVHRPDTQLTPVVHWTQPRGAHSPSGTQVAEAGGPRPAAAAAPAASHVAMSQAPAVAPRPGVAAAAGAARGAAAGRTPWQQLALDALQLLAPCGVERRAAIVAINGLSGDKELWLARGARQLAAEVARQLGVAAQF